MSKQAAPRLNKLAPRKSDYSKLQPETRKAISQLLLNAMEAIDSGALHRVQDVGLLSYALKAVTMSDGNIDQAANGLGLGHGYQFEYEEASNLDAGDVATILSRLFCDDWQPLDAPPAGWTDHNEYLQSHYVADGRQFIQSCTLAGDDKDQESTLYDVWYWCDLMYEKINCEPVTALQASAMLSITSKVLLFLPVGTLPPACVN